jgi:RimJ/RimL family protein N-acetyltransferase
LKPRIPERFHSARLQFERIGDGHAGALTALLRDPRVTRTLWPWSPVASDAQIRSSLEGKIDHWERHGFGMWALYERAGREFAGRGGLQYYAGLPHVLYRLRAPAAAAAAARLIQTSPPPL